MILVAGSSNLDFVVRTACIAQPGQTLLGRDFQNFPGGKGANQAVAAARAGGVKTLFLTALGDDDFAKPLLASLNQAGVQVRRIQSSSATGVALICVSDTGENAITVAPGANMDLRAEHWPLDCPATHLLMQLETPLETVQAFARAAKRQGMKVVLNAAPAQALGADLLALIDILIVNEGELLAIFGVEHAGAAPKNIVTENMQRLAHQHGLGTVIVTLGAAGCIALHRGEWIEQAAHRVNVLDTTGAGDTFCGSLVAALDRGLEMKAAMQEASAAAALSCTALGAQSAIANRAAVLDFMQQ